MKYSYLILLLACLFLAGCQEKKIGVEGTVTRKGQPLISGTITFTPDATQGTMQGANAITTIQDGKFTLPDKFGISGGWYKVIISGEVTVTGEGDNATAKQEFKDYITSFEFKKDNSSPITIDIPN
ncbi:MAG: hypothetical protein LBJ67_18280 [Planctomycetaceae bacterium]|jgi:hypothetical protein|nr:hypothetical protein [Planctomycetaceae bacterium]